MQDIKAVLSNKKTMSLNISCPSSNGLDLKLEESWICPPYGKKMTAGTLHYFKEATLPLEFRFILYTGRKEPEIESIEEHLALLRDFAIKAGRFHIADEIIRKSDF